jgi:hypothetical protein
MQNSMNRIIRPVLMAGALAAGILAASGQGTSFTYQGRLNDAANPSNNGRYDFQFQVFDTLTVGTGSSYGSPNPNTPSFVPVSNGLFTVTLDFGIGVFTGQDRWLQIGARTNGGGTFTPLTPRQKLTPSPYAIYAANAAQVGGQGAGAFVAKAGDTMTGTLILPANGLTVGGVGGSQLVASSGNIGIGTASPSAQLHVSSSGGDSTPQEWLNQQNSGDYSRLRFTVGGSYANRWDVGVAANVFDIYSGTMGRDFLNLSASGVSVGNNNLLVPGGNVGIGTASPLAPLHVLGGNWDVGNTEGDFRIGNPTYRLKMGVANAGGGAGDVRIHADGGTSRLMLGSGTVDVLTVISNKVGINTISPAVALDVVGAALNASNGIVRVGIPGFYQIALDFESIQSRSGTNASPLGLNLYGGDVNIGPGVMTVYDGGSGPGRAAVFGDFYSTGLTHSGSGSGTAESPDKGLILRRIRSTTTTAGSVVARTDKLTLQRDGSNGGWRIVNVASPGNTTIAATGLNSGGGTVNFVTSISSGAGAGTTSVFSDGQNVVSFRCSFGDSFDPGEMTEVSLTRYPGDSYWTGTVTSTFNQ